jgi:GT2 family glycosyltransferase
MADKNIVVTPGRLDDMPTQSAVDTGPATTVTDSAGGLTDLYDVVIVSYYSRDELQGLLDLVRPEQRIILVDNASGADRVEELLETLPHARWMDGGKSGYARAANRGAFSSTAEYVVFANPDTRPSPEIWDVLVNDLRRDPSLGSVAAATLDSSGRIQLGIGGWEPTPARVFAYAVGLHRIFPRAGMVARPGIGDDVSLGWMSGACLAVRRDMFVKLGGFDERYFVYNEDMAFGRALRQARIGQRLRTDLLVPHRMGASGAGSTQMAQQRGASMSQYLRDHNGGGSTALMRTTLAAGMLARMVIAASRRRRGLAREHAAYVRGLLTRRSPFRD